MMDQLHDIIEILDDLLVELESDHPDLAEIERLAGEARESVAALLGDDDDDD